MKINRNDPCPCESGLKYKKCCLDLDGKNIDRWNKNADLLLNSQDKDIIHKTFFEVVNLIEREKWQGACHASSSVLHILLKEQGIDNELYIGEVQAPNNKPFDHSWIEIDEKIYDVSLFKPLHIVGKTYPPIYNGFELNTKQNTDVEYGINSGFGYNLDASNIKSIPFNTYMLGFQGIPNGLYGLVVMIGENLNLSLSATQLINKYSQTQWKEKVNQNNKKPV
jgi:hypothetical protein